jgi:5-methylcytosine-specific restriction endonuclease McrA
MKKCPRCQKELPLSEFPKDKNGKVRFCCQPCLREYKREAYKKNPTKAIAGAARWKQQNPERFQENQDRYREENREKLRLDAIEYRRENKEITERDRARNKTPGRKKWTKEYRLGRLATDPQYKSRTLESGRKGNKKYYKSHRMIVLGRRKKARPHIRERYNTDPVFRLKSRQATDVWNKANPLKRAEIRHRRRAKESSNGGSFTQEEILALYEKQQGICAYCPKELNGVYHIDHFIPIARGGANSILNIRLSCRFCNQSKGDRLPYKEWIPPKDR